MEGEKDSGAIIGYLSQKRELRTNNGVLRDFCKQGRFLGEVLKFWLNRKKDGVR